MISKPLCCLLFTAVLTGAQEATVRGHGVPSPGNAIVHGRVTQEPDGAVVWHVPICVTDAPQTAGGDCADQKSTVRTESDSSGQFSLELPTGQYQLCASSRAFLTVCKDVVVRSGQDVTIDFSMRLDPVWVKAHEPAESEVMDQRLQQLAGVNALNCGHIKVKESPINATSCARRAFKHSKAFYVRYDFVGIDAEIAGGLASDGHEAAYAVMFDSMGMSSEGLKDRETMPDGSHTVVTACPKPIKVRVNAQRRITCFKKSKAPQSVLDVED